MPYAPRVTSGVAAAASSMADTAASARLAARQASQPVSGTIRLPSSAHSPYRADSRDTPAQPARRTQPAAR